MVFIQPVYYVAEKAVRVHTRQMWRRILVRLPVFGTVWFLAIAIPFFGPLNSMMGAFLVSVVVYILPAAVFIRIFSHHQARQVSESAFALCVCSNLRPTNICIVISRRTLSYTYLSDSKRPSGKRFSRLTRSSWHGCLLWVSFLVRGQV